MTIQRDTRAPANGPAQAQDPHGQGSHRGHRWMMIACCIPMLAIAVTLVAAGVVSPAFVVLAIACTVMMAMMVGAMGHGGGQRG